MSWREVPVPNRADAVVNSLSEALLRRFPWLYEGLTLEGTPVCLCFLDLTETQSDDVEELLRQLVEQVLTKSPAIFVVAVTGPGVLLHQARQQVALTDVAEDEIVSLFAAYAADRAAATTARHPFPTTIAALQPTASETQIPGLSARDSAIIDRFAPGLKKMAFMQASGSVAATAAPPIFDATTAAARAVPHSLTAQGVPSPFVSFVHSPTDPIPPKLSFRVDVCIGPHCCGSLESDTIGCTRVGCCCLRACSTASVCASGPQRCWRGL